MSDYVTDNLSIVCEMKSAWLITWEFHSQEAGKLFLKLGIKDRVIDIVDPHKDFDYIIEYTKNIYRLLNASYSEKLSLIKRGKERMTQQDYFYSNPIISSYKSSLYMRLMKSDRSTDTKVHENLLEKWENHPFHVSIGHNPSILARKVINLKARREGFSERLEWYDPLKKKNQISSVD